MGTLIQRHTLSEEQFRGERFADHPRDLEGANEVAQPDPAGDHPRHPRRVPRRRRGHHQHEHVQRERGLAGRLRPRSRSPRRSTAPAATIAREAADAATAANPGQAALRRRLARPDDQDRLHLARRQRPRRAQRHVGRAGRRLQDGRARPGRGRRRHPADRDDLRHAQRQGGDLRRRVALRGARLPAAGDRQRRRSPTSRAEPVRPDRRRLLEQRAPCATVRHRAQLLARRARCCGRTSPSWRASPTCPSSPTPTPACPTPSAATTSSRPRRARVLGPAGARGCAQPRRRLLRHHARPHARNRRGGRRPAAARDPDGRARDPPAGLEPLDIGPDSLFVNVGERTNVTGSRAFARLIKEDRFDEAVADRPPAGRQRRPDDRHQHGRGAARLGGGDGALPQPDRVRAGHRQGAGGDRLVEVVASSRKA